MADTKVPNRKDLERLSQDELIVLLDDLNEKREAVRDLARGVKEVLTEKIQHDAAVSRLAGLSEGEAAKVIELAKSNPKMLEEAVRKSRQTRPVLEATANQAEVGIKVKKG